MKHPCNISSMIELIIHHSSFVFNFSLFFQQKKWFSTKKSCFFQQCNKKSFFGTFIVKICRRRTYGVEKKLISCISIICKIIFVAIWNSPAGLKSKKNFHINAKFLNQNCFQICENVMNKVFHELVLCSWIQTMISCIIHRKNDQF